MRAEAYEKKKHVGLNVKITCAEKSMSLGSCSLQPWSLFKKSSRLPIEGINHNVRACVCVYYTMYSIQSFHLPFAINSVMIYMGSVLVTTA